MPFWGALEGPSFFWVGMGMPKKPTQDFVFSPWEKKNLFKKNILFKFGAGGPLFFSRGQVGGFFFCGVFFIPRIKTFFDGGGRFGKNLIKGGFFPTGGQQKKILVLPFFRLLGGNLFSFYFFCRFFFFSFPRAGGKGNGGGDLKTFKLKAREPPIGGLKAKSQKNHFPIPFCFAWGAVIMGKKKQTLPQDFKLFFRANNFFLSKAQFLFLGRKKKHFFIGGDCVFFSRGGGGKKKIFCCGFKKNQKFKRGLLVF